MRLQWQSVLGTLGREAAAQLRKHTAPARRPIRPSAARPQPSPVPRSQPPPAPPAEPSAGAAYPGDFVGSLRWEYSPRTDGLPDPGEVVWAWVPYEDDPARGKDRPALVVGRDGGWLLAMPLTSKDHDRDAAQEARVGRHWVDVGSGAWDRSGRASEVRVDRVVRLDPGRVRREGATLPRRLFDRVLAARATAED